MKSFIFMLSFICVLSVSTAHAFEPAELLKQSGAKGGLAVAVNLSADHVVALAKAADGRWVIEARHHDAAVVAETRQRLAQAGLFPLASAHLDADPATIPFIDQGVTLAISVAGDKSPTDKELLRVVGYHRRAVVIGEDGLRWLDKPLPENVGEWTHGIHGPDRLPVSREATIGPFIDSFRWIASTKHFSARGTDNGNRGDSVLAGGRFFAFNNRGAGNPHNTLSARCAYSGIVLWERPMENNHRSRTRWLASAGSLVAVGDRVYCYPGIGQPLSVLDAATGETIQQYNPKVRIEPGNTRFGGPSERRSKPGKMAQPAAMYLADIAVHDGKVLQAFATGLWVMDEKSGKILWQAKAPGDSWFSSAMIAEGKVFVLEIAPNTWRAQNDVRAITAFDFASGKQLWRRGDLSGICLGLIGTGGGILPVQLCKVTPRDKGRDDKEYRVHGLDTATGATRWDYVFNRYRAYVYPWKGRLAEFGPYKGLVLRDLKTGKVLVKYKYLADGGGCSFEVFTPDYVVRGSTLNPVENLHGAFSNNGVRPHCEIPSIPAYGALYTQVGKCNCDFYIPAGLAATAYGRPLTAVADQDRIESLGGATLQGPVTTRPENNVRHHDWLRSSDVRGQGKGFGWRLMDDEVVAELKDRRFAGKRGLDSPRLRPIGWYSTETTEPVRAGDIEIVAVTHEQRVEGRRDGKVVWTFLAGGRVGQPPIIRDGLAIFACHDGYVYAIHAADGSLAWRSLVAPSGERMVAFGQVESRWPCFGLVEHEGLILTTAGRISTYDRGIFAAAIEPKSGKQVWRVRLAAEPHASDTFQDGKDKQGAKLWRGPWIRHGQSSNIPPQIIDGKLRVFGSLYVDLEDPKDMVLSGDKYEP